MTSKNNVKASWKLSKQAKVFVCQRLAEFANGEDICQQLEELFNVQVTRETISGLMKRKPKKNSTDWHALMLQFRKEYLEAVQVVPIANKKVRLEYLQTAYTRAIEWHTVPSAAGPIEKCLPAAAVKALEAARQEIEGTRVIVQGSIDHRLQGWEDMTPQDQYKRFISVLQDVKEGKVATN